jgi:glycerophosphoryl diester phosphodiesterase
MHSQKKEALPGKISIPWIIAHRGAMCEAPENTGSAFDTALAYPIEGMEFDVQISKDQVPVIYHNKTLRKINGKQKRISDFLYEELKKFDWGRWYSKDFTGEKLVTLDQMISGYCRKTRLLIEIKSYEKKASAEKLQILTLSVLETIRKRVPDSYMENIFILSFDLNILNYAYKQAPHLNYVLNLYKPLSIPEENRLYPDYLYGICSQINTLTKEFVRSSHERELSVMTYSCNTARQVNKALNLCLDVIMTDRPGWIVEHLKK